MTSSELLLRFTLTTKKNVEATIGGGWNKYDGDHYGFVTWVAKPVDAYSPIIVIMTITPRRPTLMFILN